MLAANLDGVNSCPISDNGQAFVEYLEHHNGTRTLGYLSNQFWGGAWRAILTFLGRATYPVFSGFAYDQHHMFRCDSTTHSMVAKANVKSITVQIDPILFDFDEEFEDEYESVCEPLVKAIQDGTFAPSKLHLNFDATRYLTLDDHIDRYQNAPQDQFGAMSSTKCRLKELHLELETAENSSTVRVFEGHLIDMLKTSTNFETLMIDSSADPLQFSAMEVLKAATEHPCLQTIDFLPPYGLDVPRMDPSELFQMWYRANLSFTIQFSDSHTIRMTEGCRIETKVQVEKWQDFLFFMRFEVFQQIEDERTRSHLLVGALAKASNSPRQVYFLLSGNQDLFAK